MKNSFYGVLECVFDKFPKYHKKISLGYLNVEIGSKNIFKPKIGKGSLHKINMIMELEL
jgi:hypothetical protein